MSLLIIYEKRPGSSKFNSYIKKIQYIIGLQLSQIASKWEEIVNIQILQCERDQRSMEINFNQLRGDVIVNKFS